MNNTVEVGFDFLSRSLYNGRSMSPISYELSETTSVSLKFEEVVQRNRVTLHVRCTLLDREGCPIVTTLVEPPFTSKTINEAVMSLLL